MGETNGIFNQMLGTTLEPMSTYIDTQGHYNIVSSVSCGNTGYEIKLTTLELEALKEEVKAMREEIETMRCFYEKYQRLTRLRENKIQL